MTRPSKQWLQHNQVGLYAVAVFLAIGVGLGQPSAGSLLEPLINPVLAVLLCVTFLDIHAVRTRNELPGRSRRGVRPHTISSAESSDSRRRVHVLLTLNTRYRISLSY